MSSLHIHAQLKDGSPTILELCINEREGFDWVLNHEPRCTRDLCQCGYASAWGVPALLPEMLLYYKARDLRPKDEEDFSALLPHLARHQLGWLQSAIARVQPEHRWLARLSGQPQGSDRPGA